MSSDLEHRLTSAAPDARRPFDVDTIVRVGLRRRRRRTVERIGASAAALVVVTAVLSTDLRAPDTSVVLQRPAASPTGSAESGGRSGWVAVGPGESLTVSLADWTTFPMAAGEPSIEHAWSAPARALVTGAEAHEDVAAVAVAADGAALFAGAETNGVIVARADGRQHVVAADLTNIVGVPAASGGWLVLGQDANHARVLRRVAADGRVLATQILPGYPPDVGQIVEVRGDEVWAVAAWEAVEGHGPREALLATHGGDALVADVAWQAIDGGAARDDGPSISSSPMRLDVPLRNGVATIVLDVPEDEAGRSVRVLTSMRAGADDVYTLHIDVADREADGARPAVVQSSDPPELSMLMSVAGDVMRVTRLAALSQRDATLADPSGGLWFVHSDRDGYRLDRLGP